ncbi:putative DNA-binding protein [Clostridium rectalis]|uniref:putative DNA-binding protein n=1 Tax=Clostridium rectalis TaxID=2040295 RepID=UPI000F63A54F|nr:putative DNA-binding protein [Clostridium rectalis]
MDKRIKMSLLLDYYNVLLTEKQRYVMNLYYNEDFSLAEISEHTNTSRQAIYDSIKRCDKLLLEYEEKLKLMQKSKNTQKFKKQMIHELNNIEKNCKDKNCIESIEKIRDELINNI